MEGTWLLVLISAAPVCTPMTGVPPPAWPEVARFDSSLDVVRVPSRSAQQQLAPVLRTTSYPYGLAMRPM